MYYNPALEKYSNITKLKDVPDLGCIGEQQAKLATSLGCIGEQQVKLATSLGCIGEQQVKLATSLVEMLG